MSWATLEKAMLAGARVVFNNPKLRKADILEWSTGPVKASVGEVSAWVADPGVNVAINAEHDKR